MQDRTSALRTILNDVYTANSLEAAMEIVRKHLQSPECPIRDSDKRVILVKAANCFTLEGLQRYITNSFFRFERMSVR